ncbi:MAG: hypothetical protein M3Y72_11055 [Acidobacteriota bacterium]|nr:hypothetical protein [Acidobacteriota bacterium]
MGELKKVSREDFQLTAKRNYAAEERRAQISLFSDFERLIDQRQSGDIAVWQVALCLILCGLPYDETPERSVTRRARLADGSWLMVRFTATGERLERDARGEPLIDRTTGKEKITQIPLPFGADRGPLHFLINKAVLQAKELERQGLETADARFVEWEKASEYLDEMRLAPGGKNRRDLRARLERIKYCAITVTRTSRGTDETLMAPVFSRTRLPRSLEWSRSCPTQVEIIPADTAPPIMGVEFSRDFFEEFLRNHMPVPVELLRATMGRSQIQDYVLWLYWRAFAAKKDTLIPWRSVREQLWQNDSNEARLYAVMRRAIGTLRAVWPQLRAEVNPKHFGPDEERAVGLLIGPPRDGLYMFDGVESARKQITVISPGKTTKKS